MDVADRDSKLSGRSSLLDGSDLDLDLDLDRCTKRRATIRMSDITAIRINHSVCC